MKANDPPWSKEWIIPLSSPYPGVRAQPCSFQGTFIVEELLDELDRRGLASKEIFAIHMSVEETLVAAIKSPKNARAIRMTFRIVEKTVEIKAKLMLPDGTEIDFTRDE